MIALIVVISAHCTRSVKSEQFFTAYHTVCKHIHA